MEYDEDSVGSMMMMTVCGVFYIMFYSSISFFIPNENSSRNLPEEENENLSRVSYRWIEKLVLLIIERVQLSGSPTIFFSLVFKKRGCDGSSSVRKY